MRSAPHPSSAGRPPGPKPARLGPEGLEEGTDAPDGKPDVILIASGSEVQLIAGAQKKLAEENIHARVVSMPCAGLFDAESETYRESVLPSDVPTLAVEAGASFGWDRYADDVVAIDRFGGSAPWKTAMAELGFTTENVVARARALLDAT